MKNPPFVFLPYIYVIRQKGDISYRSLNLIAVCVFNNLACLKVGFVQGENQGIVISGYSTSAATDVEKFTQDGCEWARLYATYRLRQGTEYIYSNEVFIMRKDSNGHWKIYGFDLVKEEEGDTSSEEMVEKE